MASKPKLIADHQYRIIKNAPLPDRRGRKGECKYPFPDMEVGDAFDVVRDGQHTRWGQDRVQTRVSRYSVEWCKRHAPEKKFTTRLLDDNTVRCWRIA